MFAVGKFSFETLVWEDVAEFRGIEAAIGVLEEFKIGVFQFDRIFYRTWSARASQTR